MNNITIEMSNKLLFSFRRVTAHLSWRCLFIYIYMCVCVCVYIHTHTHTHMNHSQSLHTIFNFISDDWEITIFTFLSRMAASLRPRNRIPSRCTPFPTAGPMELSLASLLQSHTCASTSRGLPWLLELGTCLYSCVYICIIYIYFLITLPLNSAGFFLEILC